MFSNTSRSLINSYKLAFSFIPLVRIFVNQNGKITNRPISESELKGQHSCTYLWERTVFPDDPKHIYLLTVDLEQHP